MTKQHGLKEPHRDEIEITEGSVAEHLISERFDFTQELIGAIHKFGAWFLVSAATHVVVLIVLTLIPSGEVVKQKNIAKIISMKTPEVKEELEMEMPKDLIDNEKIPLEDIVSKEDPVIKDTPIDEINETANEEDTQDSKGDSYDFISDSPLKGKGFLDAMGLGGGAGGKYGGPDGGRVDRRAQGGGGDKTKREEVVMNGLYWLARHQNPDGSWGAESFVNQCRGSKRCEGHGDKDFDVGLTGLALLAFTGANYTPGSIGPRDTFRGIKFGDVVRKAAVYLRKIQKSNGMYGNSNMQKFMYNQAIASYAMTDLYCVMKDKGEPAAIRFKNTALLGINYIIDAQNDGKAWRYKPKSGDNDMSVSGWCMMALKTAEEAGLLKVPATVWEGVTSHLDDVTDLAYGGVGYIDRGSMAIHSSEKQKWENGDMYVPPSLTAVGVMCRIFMGQDRKNPVISNSASMLVNSENIPKWNLNKYGKVDYYYWFYGSYALNQFDGPKGPTWKKWEKEMVPIVVKSQNTKKDGCANGSWDTIDRWSSEGSRIYTTAINILTLEVYYRLRIVRT